MINFKVHGRAVPQGSKKAFVVNGRAVVTEQSGKRHKDWRKLVTETALQASPDTPLSGALRVVLDFWMPRPKKHYRRVDGRDVLRDDAPVWISNRSVGDIDKLTRAVLDALDDADVFGDDSQVAYLCVSRRYSDGDAHVQIQVSEIVELEGEQ